MVLPRINRDPLRSAIQTRTNAAISRIDVERMKVSQWQADQQFILGMGQLGLQAAEMTYKIVEGIQMQKAREKALEAKDRYDNLKNQMLSNNELSVEPITRRDNGMGYYYNDQGEKEFVGGDFAFKGSEVLSREIAKIEKELGSISSISSVKSFGQNFVAGLKDDINNKLFPQLLAQGKAEYNNSWNQELQRTINDAVINKDPLMISDFFQNNPNIFFTKEGNNAIQHQAIQQTRFNIEDSQLLDIATGIDKDGKSTGLKALGYDATLKYIDKLEGFSNQEKEQLKKSFNNRWKEYDNMLWDTGNEIYNVARRSGTIEDLQRGKEMFLPGGKFNNMFPQGTEERRDKIIDLFDRAIAALDDPDPNNKMLKGLLEKLYKNADTSVNEKVANDYYKETGWLPTSSDQTHIDKMIKAYAEAPSAERSEVRARIDVIQKEVKDLYGKDPAKHAGLWRFYNELYSETLFSLAYLENKETDPIKREKEKKHLLENIGDFEIQKKAYEILDKPVSTEPIKTTGSGGTDYKVSQNKTLNKQEDNLSKQSVRTEKGKEVFKNIAVQDEKIYNSFGLKNKQQSVFDSGTGEVITLFKKEELEKLGIKDAGVARGEVELLVSKEGQIKYLTKDQKWKVLPLTGKTDAQEAAERERIRNQEAAERVKQNELDWKESLRGKK